MDEARDGRPRGRVVRLIREDGLPRECVPTEHLNDPAVWEALLEGMPLMAMVRNLAKMTAVGLLKPGSKADADGPRPAGRCASTSASRGCTRWPSCSPRPRTPAAAA